MKRISVRQQTRLAELETRIDPLLLRQTMTFPGRRLLRPERFFHLIGGSGRLSDEESELLDKISANSSLIQALKKRNVSKTKQYKVNRAIRDWLQTGKQKGVDYKSQDSETRERQLKAIRALRFLGIDPSEATFYVNHRKV